MTQVVDCHLKNLGFFKFRRTLSSVRQKLVSTLPHLTPLTCHPTRIHQSNYHIYPTCFSKAAGTSRRNSSKQLLIRSLRRFSIIYTKNNEHGNNHIKHYKLYLPHDAAFLKLLVLGQHPGCDKNTVKLNKHRFFRTLNIRPNRSPVQHQNRSNVSS